jgi:hypothetical protein
MTHPEHDATYKLLFKNQTIMADLVRGFLAREWVGELELTQLQALPETHVADELSERRSDCVWRVPWRDPAGGGPVWLYLYFLMEFQSTVDPTMPVRMLTYLGLLYQALLKTGEAKPLALPPVLPVVLYNGQDPWTAAKTIEACIPRYPKALGRYLPKLHYLLLDEVRMTTSPQWEERNLAAAVFRMEQVTEPGALGDIADAIQAWFGQSPEHQTILRDLATWIIESLIPARLPGVEIPGSVRLSEVRGMLGERLKAWADQREAAGVTRGEAHGLIALLRRQVAQGMLTVDQARGQIRALMAANEIPAEAGQAALRQLG